MYCEQLTDGSEAVWTIQSQKDEILVLTFTWPLTQGSTHEITAIALSSNTTGPPTSPEIFLSSLDCNSRFYSNLGKSLDYPTVNKDENQEQNAAWRLDTCFCILAMA